MVETDTRLTRLWTPIETERLAMRYPGLSDAPAYYRFLRNRSVSRFLFLLPQPYTERDGREFVRRAGKERRENRGLHLALTLRRTGQLVGMVGLSRIDWTARRGELGYWIGRPHWGSGFATEAARRLCEVAFSEFQFHRIEAITAEDNARSIHLLTKLGFREEGHLRARRRRGVRWVGERWFGLLAGELAPTPAGAGSLSS